jgi:Domain of unknown function (DUF4440)
MFEILAMQSKTKLLSVVFPLVLVLLAGCAGEPKHPTWNNATGSEQHERLMWQAIKGQQWKDVESHLAPMFVGVDATGKKYNRASWMDYWKSARFSDYSLGELTVNPAGTDMVVSYILNISDNVTGNVGPNQSLRVVSLWHEVKRGWILSATSLTPIRE